MKLNQLSDRKGSHTDRKRRGRGGASGLGTTSGRGNKGQKSRTGVALMGFEGGQMPLYRRLPKRGFKNIFRKTYRVVNLGRLQLAIDAKEIDAAKPVTADTLREAGVIKNKKDGGRLLAKGNLSIKITIEVAGASRAAVAAVEKAGGTVVITGAPASAPEPAGGA